MSVVPHTGLPNPSPGAHPLDPSAPMAPGWDQTSPVPTEEAPSSAQRGIAPYQTENYKALQTFERSSEKWDVHIVPVDTNNGGTAIAAQEQKGRKRVTLSVWTTMAGGQVGVPVLYGPTEDSVLLGNCGILAVNQSVTLYTEGKVWVGLAGSQTTGFVEVITETNPAGGGML